MIIIYNLSGLLLGLGGAVLLVCGFALTRSVAVGILAAGLLWTIFGWRRRTPPGTSKAASPSIFFIPLRIYGILLLVLAPPVLLMERLAARAPADPRSAALRSDVGLLRTTQFAGDVPLARHVQSAIAESAVPEANASGFKVLARTNGSKALIVLQATNLKQFTDNARIQILDSIEELVKLARPDADELYIAIKGRFAYGALRTPTKGTQTGELVLDLPLLEFYGPRTPATSQASESK